MRSRRRSRASGLGPGEGPAALPLLSYAADKNTEWSPRERVTWWDRLSYVGSDPYYELATEVDPSTAALERAWADATAGLWGEVRRYGTPLLIHEIGFRSYDGSNIAPGEWQTDGPQTWPQNDGLQARLFATLFTEFCPRAPSEFAGLFIQGLESSTYKATGYELEGKPALETIAMSAWGGVATWDECRPGVREVLERCLVVPREAE